MMIVFKFMYYNTRILHTKLKSCCFFFFAKRAAFLVNVHHLICVGKFNTLIHTSVMLHLYFQGLSLVFLSKYGKVTLYVLYKFLLLTSFFFIQHYCFCSLFNTKKMFHNISKE